MSDAVLGQKKYVSSLPFYVVRELTIIRVRRTSGDRLSTQQISSSQPFDPATQFAKGGSRGQIQLINVEFEPLYNPPWEYRREDMLVVFKYLFSSLGVGIVVLSNTACTQSPFVGIAQIIIKYRCLISFRVKFILYKLTLKLIN